MSKSTLIPNEEIESKLLSLNESYRNGSLGKTHNQYLSKYNEIKNLNSVSNQVIRFGAKVTRLKTHIGYYTYHGVNFTAQFNSAECETEWWEVNIWDDAEELIIEAFEGYNTFDTKNEVVGQLLQLDMTLTK